MWKEIPPFSFSAGERKIMAHFVVQTIFVAAQPYGNARRESTQLKRWSVDLTRRSIPTMTFYRRTFISMA